MSGEFLDGLSTLVGEPSQLGMKADARHRDEGRLSILVVDDSAGMRESLCELMREGGYDARPARGGEEALERVRAERYDLILLDLIMPDLGGLEVIDDVVDAGCDTRVVVVSGDPSFDYVKQALTRGAVDFIRKPCEPDELLATVAKVARELGLARRAQRMEQHLHHSERLHRYLVDVSPDLIYMLDPHGRFVFVNQRFAAAFGVSRATLIGQHYSRVVSAADTERARGIFNERRTGERAAQNVELQLEGPAAGSAPPESASVELTATGIYSEPTAPVASGFLGTCGVARDVTEDKRARQLVQFQAYHDLLTRLPNRALLEDRLDVALAQARRNQRKLAIMFLDLNRFKAVNDSLGHAIGDRLLQAVASRLHGCLRRGDTLARFGGDEFMVLLPEVQTEKDVIATARKMLAKFAEPFLVDEHELIVGGSVGIAIYPDAGEDAESLIRNADIAMYRSKERGRNGYQFFTPQMTERYSGQLALGHELRGALERGELVPFYQPQVELPDGSVFGVEALARWQHPEHGLILPADFIPLAEETGLIVTVDEHIQRQACEEVARLAHVNGRRMHVSLNVSSAQLEQDRFVTWLLDTIETTGIGCAGVRLEITESMIMRDMETITSKLTDLARRGVRIGIDDFGIGYSSLSYLQRFPVDTLKIDRSFIAALNAEAANSSIVNAIIHMARGLGLDIIAEGVEHRAQLTYLTTQGCSRAQGFLFSAPLPRPALAAMLQSESEQPPPSPPLSAVSTR